MMIKSTRPNARFALPVLLAVLLSAGCAQQDPWGDPESGLILTYRMPKEQTLTYALAFDQAHAVMTGDQIRRFGNGRRFSFNMGSDETSEDNLSVSVDIDSLEINLLTSQGPMSREAKGFAGVTFGMTLTPLGEVTGFTGDTAEMKYIVAGNYEQSIEADFGSLLPLLPQTPLKVGDSWKSTGTIPGKSFNAGTTTRLELTNTLEGYETVDGLECAKIGIDIAGHLQTEGDVRTDDAVYDGEVSGEGTLYFAYKKGYVVRLSTRVQSKATQDSGGSAVAPSTVTERTKIELSLES